MGANLTGDKFAIIPGGQDFRKQLSRGDIREIGVRLSNAAFQPFAVLTEDSTGLSGSIEAVGYWDDFVAGNYSKPGKVIPLASGHSVVIQSVDGQQMDYRCRFVFRVRPPARGEVENANSQSPNPYPEFFNVKIGVRSYSYQAPIKTAVGVWETNPYSFLSFWKQTGWDVTGYTQRTRYYNNFTITLWQEHRTFEQPRLAVGLPIGNRMTLTVPGYGNYTGTCKDCSGDPHPVRGWVNTYILETVGADTAG